MSPDERRNKRRYAFQRPAWVKIIGEDASAITTVTENVSTCGVLLRSNFLLPLDSMIEVTLPLSSGSELRGVGRLVRVEQPLAEQTFLFAVKCDRPLEICRKEWARPDVISGGGSLSAVHSRRSR